MNSNQNLLNNSLAMTKAFKKLIVKVSHLQNIDFIIRIEGIIK